jgi:endo-1,4-beta-xylanase
MKYIRISLGTIAFISLCMTVSCSGGKKATGQTSEPALKETFKNDFLIGAALNAPQIEEKDAKSAAVTESHFNSVTPENIMKCEIIHPEWDRYNFTLADKYVDYAKKHNMFVVGHTLIWHSQLSPFVRRISTADSLLQFMTNHISTVAGRYAGKVNGWDVVNEALNEDGTLRKSIFLEKLGEDYIIKAFQLAQKAAPNTELYYNDYNIEQPKKRAGAIALIKKLQAAGLRIDGVGIQGHWRAYKVPLKDIEESIKEFSALGIKVHFTELDLGVLPNPWDSDAADVNMKAEYSAKMNPYTAGLPDSVSAKQAESYGELFRLFLKYKDQIARVTFWGVNDGQSWLNGWPIAGRTNYPLLFDRLFLPKPAFYKVIEAKTKKETKKSF